MGVNISELILKHELDISSLKDKIIAIDAHIFLYQFLTTIRQRDGTLLMDSQGRITSHLTGLFSRNAKLIEQGLRLVYVFDGKSPDLKYQEKERRKVLKEEAALKYSEAVNKENVDDMKKYAARTTRLSSEMIEEAKKLISAMGLPIIQAPSEAEAQAAYLVKQNKSFAVASQDADSLLFGSPKLLRNLSLAGKRKKANKLAFEEIKPEIIDLTETLKKIGISQDQLIALGMLVGTDFNEGGIKGIGPKNAVKLVTRFGDNFNNLFKEVKWSEHFNYPWQDVFDLFKNMPVTDDFNLTWKPVDKDKIVQLLVDEHDFSEERVNSTLERLESEKEKQTQKGLSEFF